MSPRTWLGSIAVAWVLAVAIVFPAQAQSVEYYHTDALGSIVAVTDSSRHVLERREYEPFGAQLTPVLQDGPGYTGHVSDAATGLSYMQQRYYDPVLGIFLSVDPVTALSNPIASFHRYRYANNNPYRFTDPDGRDAADRAYGAVVGYMLRNDPERLRIWAGGEAAATTEGSGAEQGAAIGFAVGTFFDTGDYSRDAVGRAVATAFVFAVTRGKTNLPRMRVQDISRPGAAERNYSINWTQQQFERHLKSSGYTSDLSKDGKVTNWFDKQGNKTFTTRDFSKSGGATAEMHSKGQVAAKIRFKEEEHR